MRSKLFISLSALLLGATLHNPAKVLHSVANFGSSPAHATADGGLVITTAAQAAAAQAEFDVLVITVKELGVTISQSAYNGTIWKTAVSEWKLGVARLFELHKALIQYALRPQLPTMIMPPTIILPTGTMDNLLYGTPYPLPTTAGIYGSQMGGFGTEPGGEMGGGSWDWGWGDGDGDVADSGDDCDLCDYGWNHPEEDDPCKNHDNDDGIIASGDGRVGTYLLSAGFDPDYLQVYDLFERLSVSTGLPIGFGWESSGGNRYVTFFDPMNIGVADIFMIGDDPMDPMGYAGDSDPTDPTADPGSDGPMDDGPIDDGPMDPGNSIYGMLTFENYVTSVSYITGDNSPLAMSERLSVSNSDLAMPWGMVSTDVQHNYAIVGTTTTGGHHWHSRNAPTNMPQP